jgi:CheY-like chemotaxis protein
MQVSTVSLLQDGMHRQVRSLERLNCLIVDENRHMRTILRGVLRAFGIRKVVETTDGAGAIRELKAVAADLLITEYALDTLDGIDLTKLIRTASDSVNPWLPVIMLTGYTERQVVARARDAGVNEFLAKPISAEALYVRIIGTLFSPRPFVKAKGFFGPDRRRHAMKNFKGAEQRVSKAEFIAPKIWQEAVSEPEDNPARL